MIAKVQKVGDDAASDFDFLELFDVESSEPEESSEPGPESLDRVSSSGSTLNVIGILLRSSPRCC